MKHELVVIVVTTVVAEITRALISVLLQSVRYREGWPFVAHKRAERKGRNRRA